MGMLDDDFAEGMRITRKVMARDGCTYEEARVQVMKGDDGELRYKPNPGPTPEMQFEFYLDVLTWEQNRQVNLEIQNRVAEKLKSSRIYSLSSVLQDWVMQRPLMQQAVLLALVRNEDGIDKREPQKELIKWFRRCILLAAFERRPLTSPAEPGGGSFTGPVADLQQAADDFIRARDRMSLHYFAHAMHAFEIAGYHHPNPGIAEGWRTMYERMCHSLHLWPETKEHLDRRLSDTEAGWVEREDVAGGCTT